MVLKRIGVLSSGKITGLIYALIGLLVGGVFSLFSLLGSAIGLAASGGEAEALTGALFGIGAVIILPIFYGVMGFIGGLLTAFVYNLAAGMIGGIELELEGSRQPAQPGEQAMASY